MLNNICFVDLMPLAIYNIQINKKKFAKVKNYRKLSAMLALYNVDAEKDPMSYTEMNEALANVEQTKLPSIFKYSMQDSVVLIKFIEKAGFLAQCASFAEMMGVSLVDSMTTSPAKNIVQYLVFQFRNNGYLLRRGFDSDIERTGYQGAMNYNYNDGSEENNIALCNILGLDYKSLYPSIIQAVNISPDTLRGVYAER